MDAKDLDVTVTSATQTEEQLRASMGVPEPDPKKVEEPPPAKVEPTEEEKELQAAEAEIEQALNDFEPPKQGETEAEKQARRTRGQRKLLKEMGLRKQADDALAAAKRENDALRTKLATPQPPPAAPKPGAPPAAGSDAAPTFDFPTFEEYQTEHPEADIREYTIALNDAQWSFNETRRAEKAAATETARVERELTTTFQTAQSEFKAAHPDYDTKLGAIHLLPDLDPAKGIRHPLVVDLERLVVKAGKEGPAILYFLGEHPEEVKRLVESPEKDTLAITFGEIRYAARQAAAPPKPAVPATEPTKPTPRAPAPLAETPGETRIDRSAAQVAEDDDDADAYIAKRQRELRPTG